MSKKYDELDAQMTTFDSNPAGSSRTEDSWEIDPNV